MSRRGAIPPKNDSSCYVVKQWKNGNESKQHSDLICWRPREYCSNVEANLVCFALGLKHCISLHYWWCFILVVGNDPILSSRRSSGGSHQCLAMSLCCLMYCEDKVLKSWLRTEEKVNGNSDDFDKVCKRKQGLLVEPENKTRWNIGRCWLWSHFYWT